MFIKNKLILCLIMGTVLLQTMTNVELHAAEGSKGIGPITNLKLEALDVVLATKGRAAFETKCSACHKFDSRYVGPGLKDITKKRSPEWIMNMILNPEEMTQKDPDAQALLEEYLTQMTFQNVTQDEARSILEYFRHYDEKGEIVIPTNVADKTPVKESDSGSSKNKGKKIKSN